MSNYGCFVSRNVRLIPLNRLILASGSGILQRFPTYTNVSPVAARVGTNVHHAMSHAGGVRKIIFFRVAKLVSLMVIDY